MQNKIELEDIITMKKPHACGEYKWKVIRLGADIGLECTKCGHHIIIDRLDLYKKIKKKESGVNE